MGLSWDNRATVAAMHAQSSNYKLDGGDPRWQHEICTLPIPLMTPSAIDNALCSAALAFVCRGPAIPLPCSAVLYTTSTRSPSLVTGILRSTTSDQHLLDIMGYSRGIIIFFCMFFLRRQVANHTRHPWKARSTAEASTIYLPT